MKKFIDWVIDDEGKEFFYETSVYDYAMEGANYVSMADECMYMAACGHDELTQVQRAMEYMQMARKSIAHVWASYHIYYDHYNKYASGQEAQRLWSVAVDCKYDEENMGQLCAVFRMMAMWWEKVWERAEDDNA